MEFNLYVTTVNNLLDALSDDTTYVLKKIDKKYFIKSLGGPRVINIEVTDFISRCTLITKNHMIITPYVLGLNRVSHKALVDFTGTYSFTQNQLSSILMMSPTSSGISIYLYNEKSKSLDVVSELKLDSGFNCIINKIIEWIKS